MMNLYRSGDSSNLFAPGVVTTYLVLIGVTGGDSISSFAV